jgi:hypothetical protein
MSLFTQARPAPVVHKLPSVAGVVALLATAQAAGLKYPKLWLQLPDTTPLRISVAGAGSRTPGFLMLTDGGPFGDNRYFGRISPAGQLEIGRDGGAVQAQLVPLLEQLAADPAKVAADFGHLTGNCCFCARKLADERSVAVGYGQTCAKKFGLRWGAPRAAAPPSLDLE